MVQRNGARYAIEELKILVTLQKGWEGKGVKDFIVDQPDIAKVRQTWVACARARARGDGS